MPVLPGPPALDLSCCALFLDFDGTLVGFHEDPMAVAVPAALRELLHELSVACEGALAVVSGRALVALDELLAPLVLPAAGLHGLERRGADSRIARAAGSAPALDAVRVVLAQFAAANAGLRIEDKSSALALHYRGRPAAAPAVRTLARTLRTGVARDLLVQEGHMVVEIRPHGADKGTAINDFMREPPFCGRRPVFIGDDQTDEHGFCAVHAGGGLGIKVGPGTTAAQARLADPAAVLAWLQQQLKVADK